MEQLTQFFITYGLPLTGIALVGILILGILKYCNTFKKLAETARHYIYLAISIGLSLIGTAIYLAATHQFTAAYFFAIAGAIFTLNQVFYNIFKVTPVNELLTKLLDLIVAFVKKKLGIEGKKEQPVVGKDDSSGEHSENTAQSAAKSPESDGGE